jgi:MoaA/NifB/PqqE/SkfB family radical SAM enzyme
MCDIEIFRILTKKAKKSICHYRVAALGINHRGEILACTFNKPRFTRKGGGIHAEMQLMKIFKDNLKIIYILRVGEGGDILPIHPCKVCQEKANELNIEIRELKHE